MPPELGSSRQNNQDTFDSTPHSLTSHTALSQEAPLNRLQHYQHRQRQQQRQSRHFGHTLDRPLSPLPTAGSTARASQPLPLLPPLRLLDAGIAAAATDQDPQLRLSSSSSYSAAPPGNWRRSLQTPSSITSLISTLNEIGRSLDDANTHLRTLLDRTIPVDLSPASHILRSSTAMASRPGGVAGNRRESSRSEEGSRMTKRRRLDSADRSVAPAFKGFHYGRYGQVEPGKLTMEIVSCDGGLYSDGGSYAAENILKSDNSVYCTKGNRCNIVLQHQGCTTFSLKELIIKAPGRNYSSPVREGLVFFSMTKDELLSTNQFHADDMASPAPPAPPVPPAPPAHSSSASTFNNLRLYTTARVTAERLADALNTNDGLDGVDNDLRGGGTANDLYDFITSGYSDEAPFQTRRDLGTSSHFQVMTECSDDENDEAPGRGGGGGGGGAGSSRGPHRGGRQQGASGWSPTPLRSRLRRRLPTLDESSYGAHLNIWNAGTDLFEEDDDVDQYTEFVDLHDPTAAFFPGSPRGDLRRIEGRTRLGLGGQQNIRPDEGGQDQDGDDDDDEGDDDENEDDQEDDDDDDDDETRPPHAQFSSTPYENSIGAGVIMPSAKFHIANNRTRCTIRFSPPVTARYILLKMWNPRQDINGNIDIQGVVAKGFAGPRYFPSLELR